MNMMLHGIGSEKSVPVVVGDALAADPASAMKWCWPTRRLARRAAPSSWVKTAAPAPKKTPSSATISGPPPATSSSILCSTSRRCSPPTADAAVVLPDNVLFEGGAGETIRKSCCTSAMCTPCCATHRPVLCPGREGQCAFLREEGREQNAVDEKLWITTCAPTSTSRSRPPRSRALTWTSLWRCTKWATATSGKPPWSPENPRAAGAPLQL